MTPLLTGFVVVKISAVNGTGLFTYKGDFMATDNKGKWPQVSMDVTWILWEKVVVSKRSFCHFAHCFGKILPIFCELGTESYHRAPCNGSNM